MGSYDIFYNLISHGNYDEIIEILNNDPDPTERSLLFKSESLIYKGSFNDAKQLVNPLSSSDNIVVKIDALRQISLIHWSLGEFSEATKVIEVAYNLISKITKTDFDDQSVKSHVLHMYGTICQNTGRLADSLNLLEDSLLISEELGNLNRIAATLANLAIVYSYKGDQEKTLENYSKALKILQNLGKRGDEALVLGLIGETYWEIGRGLDAITYKNQSLAMLRQLDNSYRTADCLHVLIKFLVLTNNIDLAKTYYEELSKISNKSKAFNLHFMTRFSEALILKFSPRGKQKFAAQEMFEKLLQEELESELRSQILLHLIDLVIDELQAYSEPIVLEELNSLCSEVYRMTDTQDNQYLSVEALILRAKIELINTNFKEADNLLIHASQLAETHGFDILKEHAEAERKQLKQDLNTWQVLLSKGASIKERVDRSKIREYLDDILSINRLVFQNEGRNIKQNYKSDYETLGKPD